MATRVQTRPSKNTNDNLREIKYAREFRRRLDETPVSTPNDFEREPNENIDEMLNVILTKQPDNEFVKSLFDQYHRKGYLSPKQKECLLRAHDSIEQIVNLLNETIRIHGESNKFISSLKEQFNTRGFLTDKQIVALEKMLSTERSFMTHL